MSQSTVKKITIAVFGLILLTLIVLVSYYAYTYFKGRDDGDRDTQEQSAITLNWWGLWEEPETMQVLIDKYKETHPNVTINYAKKDFRTNANGLESYKQSLIEYSRNEDPVAPDVLTFNNSWLPELETYLDPIPPDVFSTFDYDNTFYEYAKKDCTGSDQFLYCIPVEYEGLAIYYNKTLLKNKGYDVPATSWEDLLNQAVNLTQKDENDRIAVSGLSFGLGQNVTHSPEIITLLLLQRGEKVSESMPGSTKHTVSINDDVGTEVFSFYSSAATTYRILDETLPLDKQMFIDGKLAMIIAPSWYAFNIEESNPDLDYGVAKLPQLNNISGDKTYWANYWVWGVSKNSPNRQAAWEFLRFLSEKEQYKTLYEVPTQNKPERIFGRIPPRKDMAEEYKNEPIVGTFLGMAQDATSVYVGNQEEYENNLKAELDNMAIDHKSPSSAFRDFKESFDRILNEN